MRTVKAPKKDYPQNVQTLKRPICLSQNGGVAFVHQQEEMFAGWFAEQSERKEENN